MIDTRGINDTKDRMALVLYEPSPSAARSIELPDETPAYCLALGKTWAVLYGYRNDALLVRRADGRLVRFAVPSRDEKSESWRFGFDPESDDLLALDRGNRKVHRLALP